MKKLFLICFMFFSCLPAFAQDREGHREKIRALKTAHITEGLNLTAQEAQKFWPVYNKYEQKRRQLHKQEHRDIENIECISEEKAKKMLDEYVRLEREDYLLKKQFFQELGTILSAQRIIQLKKVEDDFNRKLLKEYRARQAKEVQ